MTTLMMITTALIWTVCFGMTIAMWLLWRKIDSDYASKRDIDQLCDRLDEIERSEEK